MCRRSTSNASYRFDEETGRIGEGGIDSIGRTLETLKPDDLATLHKSAELGDRTSQTLLGAAYLLGEPVPVNPLEATKWLKLAADAGSAGAQTLLATMYEGYGKHSEAAAWFGKAAEQLYPDALYELGKMYQDGRGVPQDYKKAAELFEGTAQKMNLGASYSLGVMYERGLGVQPNPEEALKRFQQAALHGNLDARYLVLSYPPESSFNHN